MLYPLSQQGTPGDDLKGDINSLHKVVLMTYKSREAQSESKSLSVVSDFATLWTTQFMEFSRPEYWSR